jgi:hypothetical protein
MNSNNHSKAGERLHRRPIQCHNCSSYRAEVLDTRPSLVRPQSAHNFQETKQAQANEGPGFITDPVEEAIAAGPAGLRQAQRIALRYAITSEQRRRVCSHRGRQA